MASLEALFGVAIAPAPANVSRDVLDSPRAPDTHAKAAAVHNAAARDDHAPRAVRSAPVQSAPATGGSKPPAPKIDPHVAHLLREQRRALRQCQSAMRACTAAVGASSALALVLLLALLMMASRGGSKQ